MVTIPLTKTTAAQNEVALSYHCVRGLYFMAVVFVTTILTIIICTLYPQKKSLRSPHMMISLTLGFSSTVSDVCFR